jgi:hypothetical protein
MRVRWSLNQSGFFYRWSFNAGSVKNHMCRQLILPTMHCTECLARTLRLESLAAWPHLGSCCPPRLAAPPPKNPGYASEPCVANLVTFLFIMTVSDVLEQPCDKYDNANKLVPSCFNNWEQAVRTQLVDSLWTDLWQLVCRPGTTCAIFNLCRLHNNVWIIWLQSFEEIYQIQVLVQAQRK